ncbi:MAG TPA: response regulator transcription factor [Thermoanaerobaculia bacterium]|nr:response regulator transcription factor [Thermoanaerobaculia bacterium]
MLQPRTRVLLADDHPMMRNGLRKLLEPDYEVVGEARDGHELLEAAERLQPDLIITDISMPGIDGIEAARRLQAIAPKARVLVLSIHTDPTWVRGAFDAGAYAYLSKASALEEIEIAVREVLKGRFYVSPEVTRGLVGTMQESPAERRESRPVLSGEGLTPRELDVVRLVGKGLGNKEIARELGVSVTTVRTHLSRVYDKLGPGSRLELALYAANAGEAVM